MKFLCRLVLMMLLFCRLEAGELYAIFVGDTVGDNIEGAVALDLRNMEEEAERIAGYTGLNLVKKIYTGEVLHPEFLKAEIDDLNFEKDDVVIFYYSGHGYRTEGNGVSPWPNMYFSEVNMGIEFRLVTELLAEKSPRLLVSLCDCCNNWLVGMFAPPVTRKVVMVEKDMERCYQKLFLKEKGIVQACSSDPGEYSWCTASGSFFTVALIDVLEEGECHSWKKVFQETSRKVRSYQTPHYKIRR